MLTKYKKCLGNCVRLLENQLLHVYLAHVLDCIQTVWEIFKAPVLLAYNLATFTLLFNLAGPNKSRCGRAFESAPG